MNLLRRSKTIAAALAAAIAVPAVALAQSGTVGIKLVEVPTDRADDPRARVYIIDHLNPGDRIERRVQVGNSTGRDLEILLYPGAADIVDDRFQTLPPGQENELVGWMSVEPDRLSLGPGRTGVATVAIDVPADAGPGERYGVFWAQPPAGGGSGPEVVNRVGVRVYLSVGSGAEPVVDFTVDSLQAGRDGEGRPVVQVRVTNTGERALDLVGELRLEQGPGGISAGPFPAERGTTLAPGDEGSLAVLLDPDLPAGPWQARMVARSGELEKAAEAEIVFPGAGETAAPVAATEVPLHQDRGFLVPLALGLLLLSLLLVALAWFLAKRRRASVPHDGDAASPGVG